MDSYQFHPVVAEWFSRKFGAPTEPQLLGWPAIQSGKHTLIAAPTGSGKTLAAFFAELDQLFKDGLAGTLKDVTRVLYVSPLKALSNDIHKNLEEPLAGIREAMHQKLGGAPEIRAAVRTGDTLAAQRQSMVRRPPHILVTTPESLYLLLTSESGRVLLAGVRTLIVDEIHAVVGNRRGTHLSLSMERLAALVRGNLQRIGLSATQKPVEEVARFLVGSGVKQVNQRDIKGKPNRTSRGQEPNCAIIDTGLRREFDLAIEIPRSPLEAVMSNEVWVEVYTRLAELIEAHRTTLVFVNTRRLAERVTHHLGERLGPDRVTSHHGSLSAKLRLEAENRLKRGELKALVATASLELGIDVGSVDLVCQLGPTRSIATLLQRVGRAEHKLGGRPKGRLFPLSRDELVECLATVRALQDGQLDRLHIPSKPLDILAQQIVACTACEDWDEGKLFELARSAYPYRDLSREEFEEVLEMLETGFSTRNGRRGALIHHDGINHRIRARRGARLIALTSGGAIPDNADYRVILEPSETLIGSVNEDFAVESMAGDTFQLGNSTWKILRIQSGTVRVADAQGQLPNIPFWFGEAPGRTAEVSAAVSDLLLEMEQGFRANQSLAERLRRTPGLPEIAAAQLAEYFKATLRALGALPSRRTLILERFFDESGGMQLVLHSPHGIRINRAWGLALRKRFCRSFNFELQAAATDDAIVLSLGTQHSFALEEVFRYLNSQTVRELLVQALLDSPMFPARWRWNAGRSLALPRQRGGRKVPPPLQRMQSENLLASVFPDQLACPENLVGDREVPNHPLVRQTIEDCLTEAMDIDGLIVVLKKMEAGEIKCLALDLPEPSPMAHEILHAKPYAFLDNAPLEERRTQAVYSRRAGEASATEGLGILDIAAITQVTNEAWPAADNPDELHEALLLAGVMSSEELQRVSPEAPSWLEMLQKETRVTRMPMPTPLWVAAERLALIQSAYPEAKVESISKPQSWSKTESYERETALRELVRGRMEISGPVKAEELTQALQLSNQDIELALLALEAEGFILRGKFHPGVEGVQWCERRLLARIHRLTLNRLRAEIQPVNLAEFLRFLVTWQRAQGENRAEGPEGLLSILEALDGYDLPVAAWEPEILALRVKNYEPRWLDQLCVSGHAGWGRLTPPRNHPGRVGGPIRSSPVSLFARENLPAWLALTSSPSGNLVPDTEKILDILVRRGALFFNELVKASGLLPSRIEQALAELAAQGWITSDSFEGLRALLLPQEKRASFESATRRRHSKAISSVQFGGRWSLLRHPGENASENREAAIEVYASVLLRRYGIVFRRLLERESLGATWFELGRVYRRLEARGEIRGGRFVSGVGGEQFARSEAIGLLRSIRKAPLRGELLVISGADPLNFTGILTPGRRVASLTANRILLRDGLPVAALEAEEVTSLESGVTQVSVEVQRALQIGTLPSSLRAYYA